MKVRTDTAPAAAEVWVEVFHHMPLVRKWRVLEETFAAARLLHEAGMRLINPQASPATIHRARL